MKTKVTRARHRQTPGTVGRVAEPVHTEERETRVAPRGGRRRRRGGRRGALWATITLILIAAVGVGGYAVFTYTRPYLHGTDCSVQGQAKDVSLELDLEQAQNASTVAAVA